jgi:hypothetical protein
MEDPVSTFKALPRRIYLDTSVLQRVFDYGGVIWDGEAFTPSPRAALVQGLADEVEALRLIFTVNFRAQSEFVVTAASLAEVENRGRSDYTQWVRDVEDTWLIQSGGQATSGATHQRVGSVSVKDWALIAEGLDCGCEAFMTMDRPLETQAPVIQRQTGLQVMSPSRYWALLRPWAALYY